MIHVPPDTTVITVSALSIPQCIDSYINTSLMYIGHVNVFLFSNSYGGSCVCSRCVDGGIVKVNLNANANLAVGGRS